MDSLFGYIPGEQGKDDRRKASSSFDQTSQYVQIIDPKKSQNLAILLKALNVTTEEVYDALEEGKSLSLFLSYGVCMNPFRNSIQFGPFRSSIQYFI